MQQQNKQHSQALDLLRFPLAIVVLLIHVFNTDGMIVHGVEYTCDDYPFFIFINRFIDAFLREKSVPIYFFISGYVFFFNVDFDKSVYIRKLKNRTKTLLIPYFIWNTLMIIKTAACYIPCLTFLFPNINSNLLNLSFTNILSCYWNNNPGIISKDFQCTMPIDSPLWFVRDLMIIVLCTPLLFYIIKRYKYIPVLIFGAMWMYTSIDKSHDILFHAFSGILFFSWGAYISILKINMLDTFNKHFKSSMVLYPTSCVLSMLSVYYFPQYYNLIHSLSVIVGMYFAYNLSSWLLKNRICKVNKFLASSSFFIYVSHWLIIYEFTKLGFIIMRPTSELSFMMVYFIGALSSILFLLTIFYLLQRFTPLVLKLFTGRK